MASKSRSSIWKVGDKYLGAYCLLLILFLSLIYIKELNILFQMSIPFMLMFFISYNPSDSVTNEVKDEGKHH